VCVASGHNILKHPPLLLSLRNSGVGGAHPHFSKARSITGVHIQSFDTVKSGLTGSGLTGQDAWSLQISYPLLWEDSGFRFNRFSGLSGQRFWSL